MVNEVTFRKQEGFKYLASRVVAALKCILSNKPRCLYSMPRSLGLTEARLLEDFIYLCGSSLPSKIFCTSPETTCRSSVETTYYKTKFNPKLVFVHCGAEDIDVTSQKEMLTKHKIVFPVDFTCCHNGKKEVVVEKSKHTAVVSKLSSSLISSAPLPPPPPHPPPPSSMKLALL